MNKKKPKRTISKILIVILCFHLSGCATCFKPKTADVSFTSVPSEATVYVDGVPVGKTPLTAELSDRRPARIMMAKEGYESKGETINTHHDGKWMMLSNIPFLIYGMVFELIFGGAKTLDKKAIHYDLEAK